MGKHRLPDRVENSGKICEYGCNNVAYYQLLNGKWCCEPRYHKCPDRRRNQSVAQKNRDDLHLLAERIVNARKFKRTIEYIREKYPTFTLIEPMRYNPDKPDEIQVHCKHHKCINSKENGGWFTPTSRQIEKRIERLERDGIDGSGFYCSDQCKQECPIYGLNPNNIINQNTSNTMHYTQLEYNIWRIEVFKRAENECEYCGEEAKHCHHSKPQKLEPFFSLDPDYGIACCEKCHFKYGHKDECNTGQLANFVC